MQDAGIAIMESFDAEIYDNTITNVKYGIRISLGGGNNQIHDNTFDTCSKCERENGESCRDHAPSFIVGYYAHLLAAQAVQDSSIR